MRPDLQIPEIDRQLLLLQLTGIQLTGHPVRALSQLVQNLIGILNRRLFLLFHFRTVSGILIFIQKLLQILRGNQKSFPEEPDQSGQHTGHPDGDENHQKRNDQLPANSRIRGYCDPHKEFGIASRKAVLQDTVSKYMEGLFIRFLLPLDQLRLSVLSPVDGIQSGKKILFACPGSQHKIHVPPSGRNHRP